MKNKAWIWLPVVLIVAGMLCGCTPAAPREVLIELSDTQTTADGKAIGTDPREALYLSRDLIYYENRTHYDSGNRYGEGGEADAHTAEEAAEHLVVNITEPGTYRIRGSLTKGQLRVNLGADAARDPDAVVTLILDGAEICCEAAPAILFLNVYECAEGSPDAADTSSAGANLILADGSVNRVEGAYVAKIYEDSENEDKLIKQDGAVYSHMSMNIGGGPEGTGLLEIIARNEGLCTEMHLSINGGNLVIRSQNDGINTNEDGVSVTAINGGSLRILAGLGGEGDGIDSNGRIIIRDGTVILSAHPASDAGLDSLLGTYLHGGTVIALGAPAELLSEQSDGVTMNLRFFESQSLRSIAVLAEDGSPLLAYDPMADPLFADSGRRYTGAVLCAPTFSVGARCSLQIGAELSGSETGGLYDPSTVDVSGGTPYGHLVGTPLVGNAPVPPQDGPFGDAVISEPHRDEFSDGEEIPNRQRDGVRPGQEPAPPPADSMQDSQLNQVFELTRPVNTFYSVGNASCFPMTESLP